MRRVRVPKVGTQRRAPAAALQAHDKRSVDPCDGTLDRDSYPRTCGRGPQRLQKPAEIVGMEPDFMMRLLACYVVGETILEAAAHAFGETRGAMQREAV
jgi:hypothetical protein